MLHVITFLEKKFNFPVLFTLWLRKCFTKKKVKIKLEQTIQWTHYNDICLQTTYVGRRFLCYLRESWQQSYFVLFGFLSLGKFSSRYFLSFCVFQCHLWKKNFRPLALCIQFSIHMRIAEILFKSTSLIILTHCCKGSISTWNSQVQGLSHVQDLAMSNTWPK